MDFGFCPICGVDEDLTREHVPQGDLGGTVMTHTCGPCNNGLGSRVEDELKHWFDDAVFNVRFSGGNVRGRRKSPRLLLRETDDGQFGLIPDAGRSDASLKEIFAGGAGEIHYQVPNPRTWRIAALKHAYLGACLALGQVPETDLATATRGVLRMARDSPKGSLASVPDMARTLRVLRSFQPATGPTVLLVGLVEADGKVVDYGLSFAGTLFVSWPLEGICWVRRCGDSVGHGLTAEVSPCGDPSASSAHGTWNFRPSKSESSK